MGATVVLIKDMAVSGDGQVGQTPAGTWGMGLVEDVTAASIWRNFLSNRDFSTAKKERKKGRKKENG